MITTNVCLDFSGILDIGYQGEENARAFAFDFSPWMEHFASGGSVRLLARRPGEVEAYPCVVTVEDMAATWAVQLADVEIPGNGSLELQYAVGNSIIKSKNFNTSIRASIAGSVGESPEPHEAWVQEVLEAADRAEGAAYRANDDADRAESAYESLSGIVGDIDAALDSIIALQKSYAEITFQVSGVRTVTCTAGKGMTWAEFADSDYNPVDEQGTKLFSASSSMVGILYYYDPDDNTPMYDSLITPDSTQDDPVFVFGDDLIIADATYLTSD